MPALDWSRVRLTPAEAAEKGDLARGGGRVVLQTVNGQPVYRFTGRGRTTVLADTGDVLDDATEPEAMAIAARFLNVDASSLRHVGVLTEPDQWTIGNRRQMPLHKIVADDGARTELYVSEPLSEVAVVTTRRSRTLAWVGAIPHWLYFVELRRNDSVWRQAILWTSGAGSVLALMGLVLGIVQYRTQYAGLMRWHYVTGVVFGVFTLTWVFSGLLSMQPWDWTTTEGGSGAGLRQAFTGRPLELTSFPLPDADAWRHALGGRTPKEVEFVNVQGEPHYLVRGVDGQAAADDRRAAGRSHGLVLDGVPVEPVPGRQPRGADPRIGAADHVRQLLLRAGSEAAAAGSPGQGGRPGRGLVLHRSEDEPAGGALLEARADRAVDLPRVSQPGLRVLVRSAAAVGHRCHRAARRRRAVERHRVLHRRQAAVPERKAIDRRPVVAHRYPSKGGFRCADFSSRWGF